MTAMKSMCPIKSLLVCMGLAILILASFTRGVAQTQEAAAESKNSATAHLDTPEYRIGPNDIIGMTIAEAPELNGKFRITESGDLALPALPAAIHAGGQTTLQLSHSIKQALIDAELFRDPTVNVYVEEYQSHYITVLGSVTKPGMYALQKRTTMLEAISLAGGLLPTAGNTITLLRATGSSSRTETSSGTPTTINLANLVKGNEPGLDCEVRDGDVLSVSAAEVVYVVGAVVKPGGFVYPDQSAGMTVLQALALAEGPTSIASKRHALIVRRISDSTERKEIPVDLSRILARHGPDIPMLANDVLFIPVSGAKQTLHAAGEVAMATVNGVAVYGLGYRIGNAK